jgi:hypothetical protein
MATSEGTTQLLGIILEEIATIANALGSLACALGERNQSAYAFKSISEKIGFLADLGLEKIDGAPRCVGDAIDWMLPEVYRDAEKAGLIGELVSENNHG